MDKAELKKIADDFTASKDAQTKTARKDHKPKPEISIEIVRTTCPHKGLAELIGETYGLAAPDMDAQCQKIIDRFLDDASDLDPDCFDAKAINIEFQIETQNLVAKAVRAGRFYSQAVTKARDVTAKDANDERDEDRPPPVGFESAADKARMFAAKQGMRAAFARARAEGAIEAYREITGSEWKAYVAPDQGKSTVARRSASVEMSAFGN